MKKAVLMLMAITFLFSSCGVVYGGKITSCQAHKPKDTTREVRPAALIGDILFFPIISLTVDFVTGGIYKPCDAMTTAHAPSK